MSMPAQDDTASTSISASCSRTMRPISLTGFNVPDGVS
jgi:hypothetical protein